MAKKRGAFVLVPGGRKPSRPSLKAKKTEKYEIMPIELKEPEIKMPVGPIDKYLKKKTVVYEPSKKTWLNFPSLAAPKKKYLTKQEYATWLTESYDDEFNRLNAQILGETWKDIDLDWREGWRPPKPIDSEIKILQRALDKYYANRKREPGDLVKIPVNDTPYFKTALAGILKKDYGLNKKDIPEYVEVPPEDVKNIIKFESDIRAAEKQLYKAKQTGLFEKKIKYEDKKGDIIYISPEDKYLFDLTESEAEIKNLKEDLSKLERQQQELINKTLNTIQNSKIAMTNILGKTSNLIVKGIVTSKALRAGLPPIKAISLGNIAGDKKLNPIEQSKLISTFTKTINQPPQGITKEEWQTLTPEQKSQFALDLAEIEVTKMRDPTQTINLDEKIESLKEKIKNIAQENKWRIEREEIVRDLNISEQEKENLLNELKHKGVDPKLFKQEYESEEYKSLPPLQRINKAFKSAEKLTIARKNPSELAEIESLIKKEKNMVKNKIEIDEFLNKLNLSPEQKEIVFKDILNKNIPITILKEKHKEIEKKSKDKKLDLPNEEKLKYAIALANSETILLSDSSRLIEEKRRIARINKELENLSANIKHKQEIKTKLPKEISELQKEKLSEQLLKENVPPELYSKDYNIVIKNLGDKVKDLDLLSSLAFELAIQAKKAEENPAQKSKYIRIRNDKYARFIRTIIPESKERTIEILKFTNPELAKEKIEKEKVNIPTQTKLIRKR